MWYMYRTFLHVSIFILCTFQEHGYQKTCALQKECTHRLVGVGDIIYLAHVNQRERERALDQSYKLVYKFKVDLMEHHNIIQPCGLVPRPWNMSIIFYVPLNKLRISIYYLYIQADTWKFGWSYTPDTIHMKHCSSLYYILEIQFKASLFLKLKTLFTICILIVPMLEPPIF